MATRLGGHTVTIVRPPGKDWRGDPLPAPDAEATIAGCFVQPRTSTEQTNQRDQVITGKTAYLPAGADIAATDRIRFAGDLYQVDGEPARWADDHGIEHHIEVNLRLVEG